MKTMMSKLIMIGAAGVLLWSCQGNDTKAVINPATTVSFSATATATTLVLDSTNAKTTTATVVSWKAANYGAQLSVDYTLQADTTSAFSTPNSTDLGSYVLSQTYTVRQLNDLALSLNLKVGVAHQLFIRVKSDVGSGIPVVYSSTVTLTVTPYSEIIPPLYPVPAGLFLVGAATAGGWNNPVPTPSQQFTQIDYKSFGIITTLTGGQQFLILPVNGSWSHKYAVASSNSNPNGDVFAPDAANNMNGPVATGLYKIIVDFVKGTYTITAVTTNPIPPNLYIVGDATPGGWNNPVPVPSQQFTQISNGEFTLTIALGTGSTSYLFLPLNGDWGHKYGGTSATGGTLLADGNVPGSNTPSPTPAGNYLIDVNFFTTTYTVTAQ
jgi:hypothetical protein